MKPLKTFTYIPIKFPPHLANFEELQRKYLLRIARRFMLDQKFFMDSKRTVSTYEFLCSRVSHAVRLRPDRKSPW